MTDHPICIFCNAALTPDTKPEHILLNALGGRKSTKHVICSRHNNNFGSTIDDALSKQVEILRNLLQLHSGKGNPPPALRGRQAGSERVTIANDGRPELVKPPFIVTELPDGNAKVEIHGKTQEALAKVLPHLAAKLRISEEQLIEQMKHGQAAIVEMRPGKMHLPFSLGGEEALRSVAKSCLVLLATVTGNEPIRDTPFAEVRDYVLQGSAAFNKTRNVVDSRDVPGLAEFMDRFGPFFNLLYVRSNDVGRVIGHFTLYNVISWQLVLAEAGGPCDVRGALVANPLDPAKWTDDPAEMPDIPFDWLTSTNRAYEVEQEQERFIAMMEHHVQKAHKTEISRICRDVFAEHGVTDEHRQVADPEMQKAIAGEIAQRLAAHALGLPHERPMTADEIEALLGGKT